jgi:hypothetical protein
LQLEGEYDSTRHDYNNTVIPSTVDLRLLNVVYADVIFVEDFARFAAGLIGLSARFPSWMRTGDEREKLRRWLDASGHGPQGIQWRNFGFLDFTKGPPKDRPRWADHAHIGLIRFAPSAIAVAIVVTPSDLFADRLQSLFRTQARERHILRWARWRPFLRFGSAIYPSAQVRSEEMEDAFLDLQREVVGLVAEHTKAGLAQGGPLPSVEVFVVDRGGVSASDSAGAEEASKRESAFWDSAGMPQEDPFAYRQAWLALRHVDDLREHALTTTWRAAVDRKVFLGDTEGMAGFAHENHKMTYLVSERLGFLAPMLACTEYAHRLSRQISALRDELAPVLIGNRRRLGIRRLGSVLSRMLRIANVDFVVKRIGEEFDYEKLVALFEREGIPGLVMELPHWQGPTALVAHMTSHLERVQEHASAQLAVLKESYSEIVTYEQIRSEQATQGRLLWLTLVLVVLTAVLTWQALPDSMRAYLLSAVRHWR